MRASAVVADPCVRPSCCPIRVCLGRHTGLPLRLRLAACRRGGGVLCIGWKGHGGRPPVSGFAGCGLSRCRMSSFAPRKAAYCAAIRGLPRRGKPRRAVALAAGRAAGGEKKWFIRKPFVWYIKVYPVPEGGKLSLTAGGVSAANVTCGKSKLLQPSPKGANGVLGYAVAGSYGYAVCPYTPITV